MIRACPICGSESGVTHGDQLWVKEVCQECLETIGEYECKLLLRKTQEEENERYIKGRKVWEKSLKDQGACDKHLTIRCQDCQEAHDAA